MKTKSLMMYSIISHHNKKRYPTLKTFLTKKFLHQLTAFFVLGVFLTVNFVPLKALADGLPSSVTIDTLSPLTKEAISPSGAPVSFSLPSASEYDSSTLSTSPATVSCANASGDTFPLGVTTVTCTGTGIIHPELSAQSTFMVTIQDTVAPTVTLNGSSTASLLLHDTFSDPGAIASDTVSGDLTSAIVVTGAVDTNATGTYTLSYSATDAASNTASVSRTVTVNDPTVSPHTDQIIFASSGVGGSISPLGSTTVPYGTDASFIISPDAGQVIDVLTVDGTSAIATTTYLFSSVTEGHTIDVTFRGTATSTDVTPPTGPTTLGSTSHTENASTTSRDVTMNWDSASDETLLAGYSYLFDHDATTTPDTTVEGVSNGITETLAPGVWYFHLHAVDSSENEGTSLHFGPILIDDDGSSSALDTTPPSGPGLVTSSTHAENATSSSPLVTMSWDNASDTQSGFGYSYEFDHSATTTPDVVAESSATTTSTTLADGTWYFHVRAADSAGNGGVPIHYGPFVISNPDITPPSTPVVTLINLGGGSFKASWVTSTDDRALAGYSYALSEGSSTMPDTSVDVNASTTELTFTRVDGVWNFSIAAVDASNNMSAIASATLALDTIAPTAPLPVLTKIGSSTLRLSWGPAFDARGVSSYKYAFATSTSALPVTTLSASTTDVTLSVSDGTWHGSVTAVDAAGNESSIGTSTAVLIDTLAPVVTLVGSSTVTLTQGDSYVEQGATAIDSHDGDLTSSLLISGTVNTAILGTTTISYTSVDSSGNGSSITRTVIVNMLVDTIPPSTVAPALIKVGSSTARLSWSVATDNVSVLRYAYTLTSLSNPSFISSSTTSTSTSNITLPDGLWYGTVKAIDTSLNEGIVSSSSALRIDTVAPVVSLNGGDTVTVMEGSVFTDPGGVALDDVDGDLTSSIVRTGNVVTSSTGTYTLRYSVQDTSGNTGEVVRHVTVVAAPDTAAPSKPVLTFSKLSSSTLLLSWSPSVDDTGVTEYDYGVGTTTSPETTYSSGSTTTSAILPVSDGIWYASLLAKDAAGNTSLTATSSGILIDTIAPSIILLGSSTVSVYQGAVYSDLGATAFDSSDGDLTSSITTTGSVDTSILGSYTLSYSISDASGNTATPVTRIVIVVLPPDITPPTVPTVILTKTASSTLTLSWSGSTDARGVTGYRYTLATSTGATPTTLVSSSTTSISLTASDALWYGAVSALDAAGNESNIGTSTGVLVDTVAPSITLNGSSTISVYQTRSYTELGATALDSHDGNLTTSIVTTGSVSVSTIGVYTLVYSISDASGNTAQVSRVVNVVPLIYFPVTASILSGKGTIVIGASSSVAINDPYMLTLLPNYGYEVNSLLLDGVPQSTSTSYTLTNVTAAHNLTVSFLPSASRNSYTINVMHTGRGSTTPFASSTLLEGEDGSITFQPGYLYNVANLTVNGLSVSTSTSYAVTNASSSYNIVVSFAPTIVDTVPPTDVLSATSSVSLKVPTDVHMLSFSWAPSLDASAGVEGYSYILDNTPSTTPDDTIDGSATSYTETGLAYGTYYFHVKALDYLGNVSGSTDYGPYLLSDSRVLIENSLINGNLVTLSSPPFSSSTALGLFGSTSIKDSQIVGPVSITSSAVASSSVTSVNLL